MAQNPFYVQPAGESVGQGIAGIGQILDRNRKEKEAKETAKAARDAVMAAYGSGDPRQIAAAAMQYPQVSDAYWNALGMAEDYQRKQGLDFMRQALSGDPAEIPRLFEERIAGLEAAGRDATQSRQSMEEFMADPETSLNEMKMTFAGMAPEEYKAWERMQRDPAKTTPYTDLAKLETDRRNQLINEEQYDFLLEQIMRPPGDRPADQRDRTIADWQRLFNMSPEAATQAYDARVLQDPTTGALSILDPISGTARPVPIQGLPEQRQPGRPVSTEVEDLAFQPSKGTGFAASVKMLWNALPGQLPFFGIFEEPEKAAQELRLVQRDAIRALASSGRPPVIEQQRIESLLPQPGEFLQNPEVADYKMTNFVDLMTTQYIDDIRFRDDLRQPKAERENSAARANQIESIIRRVLTPDAAQALLNSVNNVEQTISEYRTMPFAELQQVDMTTLDDAQLDIVIDRLTRGE